MIEGTLDIVVGVAASEAANHMHPTSYAGRLSAEDKASMREFWRFYEPRRASIAAEIQAAADRLPESSSVLSALAPASPHHDEESYDLLRRAVLDDEWEPCLASLQALAERYAAAGIRHSAWFDLLRTCRGVVRGQLRALLEQEPRCDFASALVISQGMNQLLDVAAERIAEAYLAANQRHVERVDARYHTMFERSPLPMWTYDRETLRFVAVNEAALVTTDIAATRCSR